jgi:hypothetical protein
MHHLYSKAQRKPSRKLKLELMKELSKMMLTDEVFATFLGTYASNIHDHCIKRDGDKCLD